MAAIYF